VIGALDPTFVLSNRLEAGLWTVIGIGMLVGALRQPRGVVRTEGLVAAITFAIFGGSDLVEAMTGAWWRPWWLFVWKAACVLVFLVLIVRYFRRRRRGDQSSNGCS
jgi:membrane protein implicated in regulation of membrane protease activity